MEQSNKEEVKVVEDKAKVETEAKAKGDAEAKTKAEVKETTKTVSEVLEMPTQHKTDVVGLDKFLELKKENKELKKSFKELEAKIADGASKGEVSEDIDALAEEFNVDKKFLTKLASTIKSQADKDTDEKYGSKLKSIEEKEMNERNNVAFNKAFENAMATLPEYKDLVDKEEIKKLSFDPLNKYKTFAQIIEDRYNSSLSGKKTVETTVQPGGGKEAAALDIAKARKDSKYFDEVMANPKLKAEYNEHMLKRGF